MNGCMKETVTAVTLRCHAELYVVFLFTIWGVKAWNLTYALASLPTQVTGSQHSGMHRFQIVLSIANTVQCIHEPHPLGAFCMW